MFADKGRSCRVDRKRTLIGAGILHTPRFFRLKVWPVMQDACRDENEMQRPIPGNQFSSFGDTVFVFEIETKCRFIQP